jgi:hypothetical protein
MATKSFASAAAQLQEILGPDCAIIGGLAVNAYGYVRATQDIDVVVRMPLDHAQSLLEARGIHVTRLKGDPLEGGFSCLKGVIAGQSARGRTEPVLFDILPELVPVQPERLVNVTLAGHTLRIVDIETLIRLKLRAGGPKDFYDIGILANLNPAAKQAAIDHCSHKPRLMERVTSYLDDPRVAAAAAEMQRQERVLKAFARQRPPSRARGRKR